MAEINTTHGPMDTSKLLRHDAVFDEQVGTLTAVEYCLQGCQGEAHKTGQPDAPEHFCKLHVHRSVNLAVKEGLEITGVLNALAGV